MLKKIASKLKSLFGGKSTTVKFKKPISKETKPAAHKQSPLPRDKAKPTGNLRARRKKEAEEPNRQRRSKPSQERKPDQKQKPVISAQAWDPSVFKVPLVKGKTRFHDFELVPEILHAIYDLGFKYCTPVQAETLPKSLAGEDVTAQAQTGTGKTAAFLITIFNHLNKHPVEKKRKHGTPRALILAPTRELVLQIEKDARALGKYVNASILSLLGGIDYGKQQKILREEQIDILICTPGRLIDFMNKKLVDLSKVEILVIDEADRMLDMGFIPSVKKIVFNTPSKSKRQTMFFSATLAGDVKRLAESWTRQAVEVNVMPEELAVQSVEQITYITTVEEKPTLLYNLITQKNLERVLVFVNRRDDARKLQETFRSYGISCTLLSGDVDQKQRIKRLESFREGKVRVLVATNVAARGIHVEGISHVINYNMPEDAEEYVHRIGRTGRAGATGVSINFADEADSYEIPRIEEYLGKKIECVFPEESLLTPIPEIHRAAEQPKPPPRRRTYRGGRRTNLRRKK